MSFHKYNKRNSYRTRDTEYDSHKNGDSQRSYSGSDSGYGTPSNPFKSSHEKDGNSPEETNVSESHPSHEPKSFTPSELSEDQYFETWEDTNLGLKESVLKGIYSYGYEKPSEIQKKGIIPFSSGRDVIAQAQSGTGKTGTFVISLLQKIDETKEQTQGIILVPTRELVLQTFNIAKHISSNMGIKIKTLYGGTSVNDDIDQLRNEVYHIIIGCSGRVYDMLRRGAINETHIHSLIIDEADEMLSSGFKNQVKTILNYLSKDVQVALFSATMPPEIIEVTNKFMVNPIQILIKNEKLNLKGISQFKLEVRNDKDKYDTIKDIFESVSISQCIIYCNSVKRVFDLYEAMKDDGFPVIYIHSNMKKEDRQENFREFSSGKFRVLISSDLTSRGIDIQQVGIVINFDIPNNKHTYLHRIGRSGRWGRKGLAVNFVTKRDQYALKQIEDWYQLEIKELPVNFMEYIE